MQPGRQDSNDADETTSPTEFARHGAGLSRDQQQAEGCGHALEQGSSQ